MTFDEGGVSGHPNHIATYLGVFHLLQSAKVDFKLMTLQSTNVIRKYMSYADIIFCEGYNGFHMFHWNPFDSLQAMLCHESQFVWFRRLFVIFSRYTFANSFTRYNIREKKAKVDKSNDEDFREL